MNARKIENELIDRYYRVRRLLARGGMSELVEVEHERTGRAAVLKLLPAERVSHPEYRGRLLREARLLERGRGDGVVEVFAAGECERFGPYVVMERLVGRPLDGVLAARGRLNLEEACGVFAPLAEALARVHDRRIVHRDLKPGNVFLAVDAAGLRHSVLLDFGVSRWLDEPTASDGQRLTTAGELLGTVEYMAPEQLLARHERHGPCTDVFGFGAMLFEALTSRLPFGESAEQRVESLRSGREAPPLREFVHDAPHELAELVAAMLRFDPAARPASMRDVAAVLRRSAPAASRVTERPPALPMAPVPPGAEQRKVARAPYVTMVRVTAGERVVDGRTEDISEGGLLLMLPSPLAAGTRVNLRLALPMDGAVVTVPALVRWSREGRGRIAVGLEWAGAGDALLDSVRSYVRLMQDPNFA